MASEAPGAERDAWSAKQVDKLRVALLGLNAWIVVLVVPSLYHGGYGELTPRGIAPLTLALVPLGLGLWWLGTHHQRAQVALLMLYPPAIGLTIALRPALVEREVFDPLTIGLGALSLAAYAAAALHACARPQRTMPTTVHPSRSREPVMEPRTRRFIRRALLGATTLGGLGLVAVVPVWTGRAARMERWGDGTDDATVLTIIIATVATSFALGAIVGPGLRARRRRAPKASVRRRRITVALAVAALAGVGWLLLQYLDEVP